MSFVWAPTLILMTVAAAGFIKSDAFTKTFFEMA
jgi:hypothetical protein